MQRDKVPTAPWRAKFFPTRIRPNEGPHNLSTKVQDALVPLREGQPSPRSFDLDLKACR